MRISSIVFPQNLIKYRGHFDHPGKEKPVLLENPSELMGLRTNISIDECFLSILYVHMHAHTYVCMCLCIPQLPLNDGALLSFSDPANLFLDHLVLVKQACNLLTSSTCLLLFVLGTKSTGIAQMFQEELHKGVRRSSTHVSPTPQRKARQACSLRSKYHTMQCLDTFC